MKYQYTPGRAVFGGVRKFWVKNVFSSLTEDACIMEDFSVIPRINPAASRRVEMALKFLFFRIDFFFMCNESIATCSFESSRKKEWNQEIRQKNGAGEGTRTLDIHLGKVTLYQLSYART